MKYFFKCTKCGNTEEFENPISEPLPTTLPCTCGGEKRQDYARKSRSLSLKTPESFKAGSPYAPRDYSSEGGTDLEKLGY